jgi:hypothetical protein
LVILQLKNRSGAPPRRAPPRAHIAHIAHAAAARRDWRLLSH